MVVSTAPLMCRASRELVLIDLATVPVRSRVEMTRLLGSRDMAVSGTVRGVFAEGFIRKTPHAQSGWSARGRLITQRVSVALRVNVGKPVFFGSPPGSSARTSYARPGDRSSLSYEASDVFDGAVRRVPQVQLEAFE